MIIPSADLSAAVVPTWRRARLDNDLGEHPWTKMFTKQNTFLLIEIWSRNTTCLHWPKWGPGLLLSATDHKTTCTWRAVLIIFTKIFPTISGQVLDEKAPKYTVYIEEKHRKNCECCPVSQLIVRSQRLSWIQVLNCQNCSQCLKGHKSLRSLLQGVLLGMKVGMYFWSGHLFSSL